MATRGCIRTVQLERKVNRVASAKILFYCSQGLAILSYSKNCLYFIIAGDYL
jgi:hypothetical protein